jgi:uncharacterized membrane protein YbhN (UPF0104 family)
MSWFLNVLMVSDNRIMSETSLSNRSKWFLLLYPVAGAVLAGILWQAFVLVHQWHYLAHARPEFLLVAAFNQMAVYLVLVPAMRSFYARANILVSEAKTFGLLATGMALARIIPAGEYIVWRASLKDEKGSASATTQWLILYLTWMFIGLVGLFFAAEVGTLILFPTVNAPTVAGYLRYLPIILTLALMLAVLLLRFDSVKKLIGRLAYDRFGTHAVSPIGIIRDRKLGAYTITTLTLASILTWLIEGFTLYLCFLAIGLEVPIVITLYAFAFARLFSIIPITPGSIGEIEAGTAIFFAAYSFPLGSVFTATVLYRFMSYWPPLLVGAIAYVAGGKPVQRRLEDASMLHSRRNLKQLIEK